MFKKVERIHFIGIGGAGMSGMAEVLFNLGYKVTGSDIEESPVTKRLKDLGIKVYLGHGGSQIGFCDVVVTSSAIPTDNPEVKSAVAARLSELTTQADGTPDNGQVDMGYHYPLP